MIPRKHKKLWILVGLIIMVGLVYLVVKNLRDIELIVNKAGWAAPVVVVILYGLFALTPISTDPLTIVSGAFFGPLGGIVVSWLGNNIAATVEYYFGRHIDKITNFKESKKHLPFGLSRLRVSSPWFLIFGRLIPGYGGKVISVMGGMYHVTFRRYLWTTLLVNLCGSLLLTLGGYHLIHLLKF